MISCSELDIDTIIESLPIFEIDHMRRVGYLAGIFSDLFHRNNKDNNIKIKDLGEAAKYHDFGKIWIPPELLSKTDKLSDQEYEHIKKHPVYALEYINSHPDFFIDQPSFRLMIFDVAIFHHERWDGKGYPYGLQNVQIPLVARMTSLCDVYDVITNHRPYREARTHLEACSEIERWSGQQFDPTLVRIFLDCNELIEKAMLECQLSDEKTIWRLHLVS